MTKTKAEITKECNEKCKETADRMRNQKTVNNSVYETYNEALINYLPKWQRPYAHGECYLFLCKQLKNVLEDKLTDENLHTLQLSKDNFESYCETCLQEKIEC